MQKAVSFQIKVRTKLDLDDIIIIIIIYLNVVKCSPFCLIKKNKVYFGETHSIMSACGSETVITLGYETIENGNSVTVCSQENSVGLRSNISF